jgi:hypothetical protein
MADEEVNYKVSPQAIEFEFTCCADVGPTEKLFTLAELLGKPAMTSALRDVCVLHDTKHAPDQGTRHPNTFDFVLSRVLLSDVVAGGPCTGSVVRLAHNDTPNVYQPFVVAKNGGSSEQQWMKLIPMSTATTSDAPIRRIVDATGGIAAFKCRDGDKDVVAFDRGWKWTNNSQAVASLDSGRALGAYMGARGHSSSAVTTQTKPDNSEMMFVTNSHHPLTHKGESSTDFDKGDFVTATLCYHADVFAYPLGGFSTFGVVLSQPSGASHTTIDFTMKLTLFPVNAVVDGPDSGCCETRVANLTLRDIQ